MVRKQKIQFEIGDRVRFRKKYIETFKEETESSMQAVRDYRRLVLAGIDEVGVVIADGPGVNLTTVGYPDGWNLPLPTKYLELVSQ